MGSGVSPNGRYLRWFYDIEKSLWSLFRLFGDLCATCAEETLRDISVGDRKGREAWCCCMIDNQVHDNWNSLNATQSRTDKKWYERLRSAERVQGAGRGPCPALGEQGCRIKKWRPITCTTQLCSKMLVVLNEHGVVRSTTHSALQIEDLIQLPDILPELYGVRKGRTVTQSDVDAYLSEIHRLKKSFAQALSARDGNTSGN